MRTAERSNIRLVKDTDSRTEPPMTAVAVDTRHALVAAFTSKILAVSATATKLAELLQLAESYTVRPAARGEVRFYKKHYATRSHDVMVRVPDGRCNRWQGAHAGHKAQEGTAKLEANRTAWKTIHHCASCTGGGMWRVRW
jgi:hypothetical protein